MKILWEWVCQILVWAYILTLIIKLYISLVYNQDRIKGWASGSFKLCKSLRWINISFFYNLVLKSINFNKLSNSLCNCTRVLSSISANLFILEKCNYCWLLYMVLNKIPYLIIICFYIILPCVGGINKIFALTSIMIL